MRLVEGFCVYYAFMEIFKRRGVCVIERLGNFASMAKCFEKYRLGCI